MVNTTELLAELTTSNMVCMNRTVVSLIQKFVVTKPRSVERDKIIQAFHTVINDRIDTLPNNKENNELIVDILDHVLTRNSWGTELTKALNDLKIFLCKNMCRVLEFLHVEDACFDYRLWKIIIMLGMCTLF